MNWGDTLLVKAYSLGSLSVFLLTNRFRVIL